MPDAKILPALTALLGAPETGGNSVSVLRNGDRIFPAMLDAIECAEHTIEFLTFVYWSGNIAERFAKALANRARAGVQVRVVLDSFGAFKMSDRLAGLMTSAGVQIAWFRPLLSWRIWQINNRTHRRVLICDGSVAFTGGVGIAQEWQGDARTPDEWRDTHFLIRGPAVAQIRAAFWGNWLEARGGLGSEQLPLSTDIVCEAVRADDETTAHGDARLLVIPSIASTRWSHAATLASALIHLATHRLRIATAYFAPDQAVSEALLNAVGRGVTVEVMFPGRHADKRMSQLASLHPIRRLIQGGVTIHRYDKTMMHQKIWLVDDRIAVIGSANANHRSWMKDDEICIVVDDAHVAHQLSQHFDVDVRQCVQLDADALGRLTLPARAVAAVASMIRHEA